MARLIVFDLVTRGMTHDDLEAAMRM